MNRASWIHALSLGLLVAACAHPRSIVKAPPPSADGGVVPPLPPARTRPARVIVFWEDDFPTVDSIALSRTELDEATKAFDVVFARQDRLDAALQHHPHDVLFLPYGSAFPVDSWAAIRTFLGHGGSLLVLGGAPFYEPVRRSTDGSSWTRAGRSPAFADELLIGPAEPIQIPHLGTSVVTWALTVRLTNEKEFPDEHGTAGPRDAVVRPLRSVSDGTAPRGCALLEVDRVRGDSAGARWLFATTNQKHEPSAIRSYLAIALQGSTDTRAIPARASIAPGDAQAVDVTADGPFRLKVLDPSGNSLFETKGNRNSRIPVSAKLTTPGRYRIVVHREDGPEPREAASGFWVRDDALLKSGPKLGVTKDWLTKDGKPFPIIGTTYMASDAHRHFLFEPNPEVWDADFAEMERRGVNFVRTGIWTAWSRFDDAALDAVEAFVETAAAHGIVVCFNLFAFLPQSYGGDNPYLDPRSLEGQKAFVAEIARRFAGVSWVHWDLINEPSYAPRPKLWSTRPIGDAHEAAAWRSWVDGRHDHPTAGALAALWSDASGDPMRIPTDEDFERAPVMSGRHPRKARDFREMTEEVVASWAKTMRDALKGAAGSDTLVTLGQDEGGIYERATQQFLADSLDYTAVHTWWKNDDLLWDGVTTKVVGKPSLHQETGLMRLEKSDGTPWRDPPAAAKLLERKLGYSFAARGAGVVEWVWNVNPYMPIDEETTIGIFRPDGTAKPELDALEKYATFFRRAAPYIADFEPDPVLMLIPHARAFSGFPHAIDATKVVVRTLAERFGIVPATMSDLHLRPKVLEGVKLVIVPNPTVLDEPAAKMLLDAAKNGTKVLVTGAIEGDSYGRETPSVKALIAPPGVTPKNNRPVAMHEETPWSLTGSVAFEGLAQETLLRAETPPLRPDAMSSTNLWREPLPLELAQDRDPFVRLLRAALEQAHVRAAFVGSSEAGVAGRVLYAPKYALVVLVNERPAAAVRRVAVDKATLAFAVDALGTRLAVVDRATGAVIVSMPAGT